MRERYYNFMSNNRDTIAKIFSLIIAILLWYFIITEIDPVIKKDFQNVEVELRNQSVMREAGLELVKPEDYTTSLTVSGKRSSILGLKEEDISAYVDLGEVQPGSQRLPIHYRISDESVTIERSNPTAITLAVDEMMSVEKPVEVRAQGKPLDSYVLDRILSNPEKVTVAGPRQQVDKVQSVIGYVPVNGQKDTVVSNVELIAVDQDRQLVKGVDIKPNTVSVQAVISKAVSVPVRVDFQNPVADGFQKERAILTPSSVMITGEGEQVDKIESIVTEPVSTAELMEVGTMPLTLIIPEGVHLVSPDENIMLRYMKNESERRTIALPGDRIEMEGKKVMRPETVTVDVYGEQRLIQSINPEDLSITVNGEGELKVTGPKGMEVISVSPSRLTAGS